MKNTLDTHIAAYRGNNLYDFDNNVLLNWYPQRILKHTKKCNSLLELGIGHGITTNIFSNKFKRHIVLDASPAVIKNFRENNPTCNAEIIETYFERFTSTEKFDVIVAGFVLEHVEDPIKTLEHMKQFLRNDGRIFVTVPNAEVLNRRLGYLAGLLPDMQQLSEHDYLCGHKRYYTVESLTSDLHSAGYKLEQIEGLYLKPLTTNQMLSLQLSKDIIDALCEVGINYPELSCAILAKARI